MELSEEQFIGQYLWDNCGNRPEFKSPKKPSATVVTRNIGFSSVAVGIFAKIGECCYFLDKKLLSELPVCSFGESIANKVHMACPLKLPPSVSLELARRKQGKDFDPDELPSEAEEQGETDDEEEEEEKGEMEEEPMVIKVENTTPTAEAKAVSLFNIGRLTPVDHDYTATVPLTPAKAVYMSPQYPTESQHQDIVDPQQYARGLAIYQQAIASGGQQQQQQQHQAVAKPVGVKKARKTPYPKQPRGGKRIRGNDSSHFQMPAVSTNENLFAQVKPESVQREPLTSMENLQVHDNFIDSLAQNVVQMPQVTPEEVQQTVEMLEGINFGDQLTTYVNNL